MKVALYIADSGSIVDKLINVWTGLYGYSHTEIAFDTIGKKENSYLCCSSSPRDGDVRFTNINLNSGHWHVINFDIPAYQEKVIYDELRELTGAKYDWKGIFFTFIFSWVHKQDDKKWWCSELTAYILNLHVRNMNFRISPNKLAKRLDAPRQPFSFKLSFKKSY